MYSDTTTLYSTKVLNGNRPSFVQLQMYFESTKVPSYESMYTYSTCSYDMYDMYVYEGRICMYHSYDINV